MHRQIKLTHLWYLMRQELLTVLFQQLRVPGSSIMRGGQWISALLNTSVGWMSPTTITLVNIITNKQIHLLNFR
jgi:hypothetical protein